jgi:uncharacterized protein (UPF0332 family)
VTPEAERYLTKARLTLDHGRTMLTVNLTEDAGRAAYLAGYQAAEAFIFERTGKATKTHKGAHTEFARLAVNEPRIDAELRRFLPQAYDLKAICDYELGPDAVVPHDKAVAALEAAARFVTCIAGLLAA